MCVYVLSLYFDGRLETLHLYIELYMKYFHIAGEYERVQKKAFTNWVNSHLLKVFDFVFLIYKF